jgi:hypothetical protein
MTQTGTSPSQQHAHKARLVSIIKLEDDSKLAEQEKQQMFIQKMSGSYYQKTPIEALTRP